MIRDVMKNGCYLMTLFLWSH